MDFLSRDEKDVIRQVEQLGPNGLKENAVMRDKLNRLLERVSRLQSELQQEQDRYGEYLALEELKRLGV